MARLRVPRVKWIVLATPNCVRVAESGHHHGARKQASYQRLQTRSHRVAGDIAGGPV
jgi:hypothetical protein